MLCKKKGRGCLKTNRSAEYCGPYKIENAAEMHHGDHGDAPCLPVRLRTAGASLCSVVQPPFFRSARLRGERMQFGMNCRKLARSRAIRRAHGEFGGNSRNLTGTRAVWREFAQVRGDSCVFERLRGGVAKFIEQVFSRQRFVSMKGVPW